MLPLTPEAVVPRLRGRFGRPYHYAERTASTQRLLDPQLPEGAVAVAEEQTEGRGRLGRRWEAPAGTSVLVSVLLRPQVAPDRLPELSVVAGEAVAEAIAAVTALAPRVKLPNDVLLGDRKVAGVIGEAREGAVVLGIGINVNIPGEALPQRTRLPATSLLVEGGRTVDRAALLTEVLARLESRYDRWAALAEP